jgi:3-oxoacyl-[acyl-carrier-protein] synthase-3
VLSLATYIPETFMSSSELAEATGISLPVIEEKFGIRQKPIPGPDDHPCEMGAKAARKAIARAGIDPLEIDVVLSISEEYKEYPLMTSGIKIQQLVGARNAWAMDVAQRCCTAISGLKLAQALLRSDPRIRTILLAGGYRNGDLIDYRNSRVSFMFSLAAAGGAILLRRGETRNQLLEASLVSDGDFADDVRVEAGGTRNPVKQDHLGTGAMMLDVTNVEAMKERLGERSHTNFMKVIREAAEWSGYQATDIGYMAILHMKRSAHLHTLAELGLTAENSFYLEDFGHIGQFDPILSIEKGVETGRLKPGTLVMMASAGVSYAWGAQALRWG